MKLNIMHHIKGSFQRTESYDSPIIPRVGEQMAFDTESTGHGLDCIVYEVVAVCYQVDNSSADIYLSELCRNEELPHLIATTLVK